MYANTMLVIATVATDLGIQYYDHSQWVKYSWLPREQAAVAEMRRNNDNAFQAVLESQESNRKTERQNLQRDVEKYTTIYEETKSKFDQLSTHVTGDAALKKANQLYQDLQDQKSVKNYHEKMLKEYNTTHP